MERKLYTSPFRSELYTSPFRSAGRGSRGSSTTHATEYVNSELAKTFTLGHDVLTQADAANGALTLIYDGHGSTRALLDVGGGEEGGVAASNCDTQFATICVRSLWPDARWQGTDGLIGTITSVLYSGEMTDELTVRAEPARSAVRRDDGAIYAV